jgi:hypothetical protein
MLLRLFIFPVARSALSDFTRRGAHFAIMRRAEGTLKADFDVLP